MIGLSLVTTLFLNNTLCFLQVLWIHVISDAQVERKAIVKSVFRTYLIGYQRCQPQSSYFVAKNFCLEFHLCGRYRYTDARVGTRKFKGGIINDARVERAPELADARVDDRWRDVRS